MRTIVSFLCCTIATAMAQESVAPAGRLHVPAGRHSVEQLLQLVGQAVRSPIRIGEGVEVSNAASLRLQRELVLPGGDWEGSLAALLATRQLVLTFDPVNKRHEVMGPPQAQPGGPLRASSIPEWVRERAVKVPVEQLATLEDMQGPVHVVVPTKVEFARVVNGLRPYLASVGTAAPPVACESEAGGLGIVGLAPTVRLVLRVVTNLDPSLESLSLARPPAWPRASTGSHRLEAGTYKPVQLVDLLASRLGRNIVMAPDVDALTTEVEVAEALSGDDFVFEAKVSALLWQCQVLVVGLLPKHGLYEALPAADVRHLPSDRASPMSPAEVLARPELVAFVTVRLPTGALTPTEAINRVRPLVRGSVSVGALGDSGLALQGLVCDLAPLVRAVSDQAPAATGK